jgi:WD40 repeat protein
MKTASLLVALLAAAPQDPPKGAVSFGTPSKEWKEYITALACSPDGKSAVSARNDGEVRVWDLGTQKPLRTLLDPSKDKGNEFFRDQRRIEAVAYTPDGRSIVAVGFGFGIRVWDSSTGELQWQQDEGREALSVSADGNTLLTVKGFRGEIDVWDLVQKVHTATIAGHKQSVNGVAFSPDGKSVYSCSTDLTVRKWDLGTKKELWRLGTESAEQAIGPTFPQHLRLSPDGKHLAITYHGCWKLKAALVDPESGKVLSELDVVHSDGLAFMSRESVFALQGAEGRPVLIDASTLKIRARGPQKLADRVFGMAFTPDGKRLLTTRQDGTFLSWDLSGFEPLRD